MDGYVVLECLRLAYDEFRFIGYVVFSLLISQGWKGVGDNFWE